jgi:hypothetical protein
MMMMLTMKRLQQWWWWCLQVQHQKLIPTRPYSGQVDTNEKQRPHILDRLVDHKQNERINQRKVRTLEKESCFC